MKFSSMNKKGICSVQVIIILCSCLILSAQILTSSRLSMNTISRRQEAVQERLYGESLFQVADVYLLQNMNSTYNIANKDTFTSGQTDDEIKKKVLRYALQEMAVSKWKILSDSIKASPMLKDMGIECTEVSAEIYTYDSSAGAMHFKKNTSEGLNRVNTCEDFALKINIKARIDGQTYVYGKDYFFVMPLYTDEMIAEIKAYYASGGAAPWTGNHEFDLEKDIISSEVYYEKK